MYIYIVCLRYRQVYRYERSFLNVTWSWSSVGVVVIAGPENDDIQRAVKCTEMY
jgi:hypothetical protein